jgi:hypothetical protein
MTQINPLEERIFELQDGKSPLVKMWDYGQDGLSIFVMAK